MDRADRHAAFSEDAARRVIDAHSGQRGPLLIVLHALQEHFGYLDERVIPVVADALNLSRAEVYGVITFYKDFRREAPAALHVKICRAEACQAVGAEALVAHATEHLGIDLGGQTPDGRVRLDQVFCLGNCALSPAVMVEDRLVGKVTNDRFDELVAGRP